MLTIVRDFHELQSLITDHCNKYNSERFEILQKLSKCDTETKSEQILLEK